MCWLFETACSQALSRYLADLYAYQILGTAVQGRRTAAWPCAALSGTVVPNGTPSEHRMGSVTDTLSLALDGNPESSGQLFAEEAIGARLRPVSPESGRRGRRYSSAEEGRLKVGRGPHWSVASAVAWASRYFRQRRYNDLIGKTLCRVGGRHPLQSGEQLALVASDSRMLSSLIASIRRSIASVKAIDRSCIATIRVGDSTRRAPPKRCAALVGSWSRALA